MKFLDEELFNTVRKSLPICCVDLLFIDSEDRILLMRRSNYPAKGLLWYPGGRIFKDEHIDQTILRKSVEETSIVPDSHALVDIQETIFDSCESHPYSIHTINLCFLINWSKNADNAVINDNQHSDLSWLPISEVINSHHIHNGVSNPLQKLTDVS